MPSTQTAYEKNEKSHKKTKKQKPDSNDSLNYLPKMHNVYKISTSTSSDLDIYGKKDNQLQ